MPRKSLLDIAYDEFAGEFLPRSKAGRAALARYDLKPQDVDDTFIPDGSFKIDELMRKFINYIDPVLEPLRRSQFDPAVPFWPGHGAKRGTPDPLPFVVPPSPDCGQWVAQWNLERVCNTPAPEGAAKVYQPLEAGSGLDYVLHRDNYVCGSDSYVGGAEIPPPSSGGVPWDQVNIKFAYGSWDPVGLGPQLVTEWWAKGSVYTGPCVSRKGWFPPEIDPNELRKRKASASALPEPSQEESNDDDDDGFVPPAWVVFGPGPMQARPHPRRPPRGRRDKKPKSLIQKVLKVADIVSESAEVVDALFEALPCDVQKKAKRAARKKQQIDAMGQYGIDGADWKLKALYDHWNEVDASIGVANIVRNEIQDQAYGFIQKRMGKHARYANGMMKMGAKERNDLIDGLVDRMSRGLGLPPARECK